MQYCVTLATRERCFASETFKKRFGVPSYPPKKPVSFPSHPPFNVAALEAKGTFSSGFGGFFLLPPFHGGLSSSFFYSDALFLLLLRSWMEEGKYLDSEILKSIACCAFPVRRIDEKVRSFLDSGCPDELDKKSDGSGRVFLLCTASAAPAYVAQRVRFIFRISRRPTVTFPYGLISIIYRRIQT